MAFGHKKHQYVNVAQPAEPRGAAAEESVDAADERRPFVAPEEAAALGPESEHCGQEELVSVPVPEVEARLSDIESRVRHARVCIDRVRSAVSEEACATAAFPTSEKNADENAAFDDASIVDVPSEYDPFEYFDTGSADPVRVDGEKSVSGESASFEELLFSGPPVSIEEGMRHAESEHNRQRANLALAVSLVCVVLVAGALIVFGLPGLKDQDVAAPSGEAVMEDSAAGDLKDSSDDSLVEDPTSSDDDVAKDESTSDGLGEVTTRTRQYKIDAYGSENLAVREVIEFGSDGLCDRATVTVTFSNREDAEAFCADMKNIQGENCIETYVDGQTGVAIIDISDLNKTEREYYPAVGGELLGLAKLPSEKG